MRYAEWNTLSNEERKNIAWHRHPHIRIAKIFAIVFILAFIIVLGGINKSTQVHLNKQPTSRQAFITAISFVKNNLKEPSNAVFPGTNFTSKIDTSNNNYQVNSTVKIEDTAGKMNSLGWMVKMHYTGGDWADKNSWKLLSISIH